MTREREGRRETFPVRKEQLTRQALKVSLQKTTASGAVRRSPIYTKSPFFHFFFTEKGTFFEIPPLKAKISPQTASFCQTKAVYLSRKKRGSQRKLEGRDGPENKKYPSFASSLFQREAARAKKSIFFILPLFRGPPSPLAGEV